MKLYWLLFALGVFTAGGLQAGSIQYDMVEVGTSSTGDPIYRLTYATSGITFLSNRELELRFDPALFGQLSNGVASPDFDVLLFQPNNPPGTVGIYSALALRDNPSLTPAFRVDVVFLGPGLPPPQPFFINQYGPLGDISVLEGGTATFAGEIPEPATLAPVGFMLIAGWWAARRRKRGVL